jgi:hypothetical protein
MCRPWICGGAVSGAVSSAVKTRFAAT